MSPKKKSLIQVEKVRNPNQLLKEADQVDEQLKKQLEQIQMIREQTRDAIKNSKNVVEVYRKA